MKFKLLLIIIYFIPAVVLAQFIPPPWIDAQRYTHCIDQGLGKGRSYATPENYCQNWAGLSRSATTPSAGNPMDNVTCYLEGRNGIVSLVIPRAACNQAHMGHRQ